QTQEYFSAEHSCQSDQTKFYSASSRLPTGGFLHQTGSQLSFAVSGSGKVSGQTHKLPPARKFEPILTSSCSVQIYSFSWIIECWPLFANPLPYSRFTKK